MRRRRKESGETGGLNMTPVLGVVFIILLFFVVTAPFLRERGFEFYPKGPHPCGDVQIIVEVDDRNRIFVAQGDGARQVGLARMKEILARGLAEYPDCRSVLVQAHPDAAMGAVIRVMDHAKAATDPPPNVNLATVERR